MKSLGNGYGSCYILWCSIALLAFYSLIMKTLRLFLFAILPALLLLSSFRSTRFASREVRQLGAFTELKLGGSPKIVLRQGSPQKVELEGDAADLARIETVVSSGQLRVGFKNTKGRSNSDYDGGILDKMMNSDNYHTGPVTIYITMPEIKGLSVSGSGSIRAAESLKANDLDLAVSGSGSISLGQVQSSDITSALSGSGSIILKGSASRHDVRISGSGSVQSADLRVEASKVSISGSGNCRVNASKTLDARIAGSGSIYVTGNPQINSSIAGSGRVHRS